MDHQRWSGSSRIVLWTWQIRLLIFISQIKISLPTPWWGIILCSLFSRKRAGDCTISTVVLCSTSCSSLPWREGFACKNGTWEKFTDTCSNLDVRSLFQVTEWFYFHFGTGSPHSLTSSAPCKRMRSINFKASGGTLTYLFTSIIDLPVTVLSLSCT